MRLSKMVGLLLAGAFFCATLPVGAQQVDDQMRATARSLADEGITFFDQGKFTDALDRFERADAIVHAPTVGLLVARTLEKLGRLVEASERYRALMNVPLDDKSPEAFRAAQETASKELTALTPRIPSFEIVIEGPAAEQAVVLLDGKPVPKALLGVKTLINPGVHRLQADTPTSSGVLDLKVEEKQNLRALVTLKPKEAAALVGPTPPIEDQKPLPPGTIQRYAAYGAFGVGGVGLLMGAIAGGVAIGEKSDLATLCEPNPELCNKKNPDPSFTKLNNSYNSDRTLSTVGFVIGGVGLAAGAVLFFTLPKAPKADPKKATIEPWVGFGSAGFSGTF